MQPIFYTQICLNIEETFFPVTHHISIRLLSTDTLKGGEDCCRCKRSDQRAVGNTSPPAVRQRFQLKHIQNNNTKHTCTSSVWLNYIRKKAFFFFKHDTGPGNALENKTKQEVQLSVLVSLFTVLRALTSVTRRRPRKKQIVQRQSSSNSLR